MVAVVFLIVAWQFRALGVSLLNLGGVALAYLISVRVVAEVGEQLGLRAPQEVEPLIVALLFGVVTDYLVFFAYGFRRRLAQGMDPRRSAVETTAGLLPVVLTAGLIIAGACATLLLADLSFLRSFGPGMAVSVLVSIAVAITFFPAALALTGDRLFWPRRSRSLARAEPEGEPRGRITGLAARYPLVVGMLCLALLASAATGLREMSLGNPVMRGLPSDADAARGYASVSRGFGPGLIAPTLLVVKAPGIGSEHSQVSRLQALVSRQPGVAGVIGPATGPLGLAGRAMSAPDGSAVRFFVITDSDPYGGTAIDTISRLDSEIPSLLDRSGLSRAKAGIGGDTALTGELVGSIGDTGLRVGPAAIAWVFLLLALLLRALVAPLYLLAASILGVAAALGLTVYVFQDLLDYGQLSLFVPFSAAILLLALGSDYSVFVVDRIWKESRHRALREAIRIGGSRAGSAIRTAGLILALSFAAVALIPEQAFRELGFAMAAGLLIDTLLVRALLVPALIAGFGRGGAWPGSGLRREAAGRKPRRACPKPPAARRPAPRLRRMAETERVLSTAELNRALLARQMLLERKRSSLPRALERIAGIQAQYAPSMYVGLWTRLEGFERGEADPGAGAPHRGPGDAAAGDDPPGDAGATGGASRLRCGACAGSAGCPPARETRARGRWTPERSGCASASPRGRSSGPRSRS